MPTVDRHDCDDIFEFDDIVSTWPKILISSGTLGYKVKISKD